MRTLTIESKLWLVFFPLLLGSNAGALARTADEAWLRYPTLSGRASALAHPITIIGKGEILNTAAGELIQGLGESATEVSPGAVLPNHDAFVLGEWQGVGPLLTELDRSRAPSGDGFWLKTVQHKGVKYWVIVGASARGVLYGAFRFLALAAEDKDVSTLDDREIPAAPIRWASQWDNLDGSIERGYGGRSIFFEGAQVRPDLTRVREYARLLASLGINACVINNVNADPRLLKPEAVTSLARVAEVFRPWGVRLAISVDLSSPMSVGGLNTFDPLNPEVAAWWRMAIDRIYQAIPDFAGFVVKADSEGRSGPSQYGRTAAEAANVMARPLAVHDGVMLYRTFVYNHHLDWRDAKADRARAAYDYFHPLDGRFEANVVLQIKYGPIDFQVREPASPLFGAMPHANEAIELQVTQEYTGQQRHLCFLVPMWKEILDFDMHVKGETPVKTIVSGAVWGRPLGGYNAVINVGLDPSWLGSPLAMANLYGYGRLAWNPDLSSEEIVEEWIRLTFGASPKLIATVSRMLLSSWHSYESYTGPLGAGTLTDILGPHYGPGVESSERNGWGQWHRADHQGVGMDRTTETGTGYIGQYSPEVARLYEPPFRCPDNLLLFMHHVPYSFVLHSGKTVIQHIYDSHYAGAEEASTLVDEWSSLEELIDRERYQAVRKRLEYQAGHAMVWRDAVVNWFFKLSGIPDAQNRVGFNPNRIEAEDMKLSGYQPVEVTPSETASGGKAVVCRQEGPCEAVLKYDGKGGRYDIKVQYFDLNNGISRYQLWLGDRLIDSWSADDRLPSNQLNGHTSTRHTIPGVELKPFDSLKIVGYPDGGEPAPLDYVEVIPSAE